MLCCHIRAEIAETIASLRVINKLMIVVKTILSYFGQLAILCFQYLDPWLWDHSRNQSINQFI